MTQAISKSRFAFYSLLPLMMLTLGACTASSEHRSAVYDPFEPTNRAIFAVNDVLDDAVAKPVAKGYHYAVPEPARVGVRNILRNLNSPLNIAHQLLQGDFSGMGSDVGRAVLNTTLGIGGLFDVAGYMGMEYEPEDFGQTMAVWGLSEGPYIVIPLLGPSNVRDGTGRLVDGYVDPIGRYLINTNREDLYYTRAGVSLVSQREEVLDLLEDLEKNSIDYYAVMRSSYQQYRDALIRDEKKNRGQGVYAGPADYDYYDDLDY